MKQFELWWAVLPVPIGRRPVLLLSRTPAYEYLSKIVVAEVSTTIRGIPQEVKLGRREGLSAASVANCDNVHVIPKQALSRRIGVLASARHVEVKRALGYAFDWAELKLL
jgi:mRNA interferase MazF